MKISIDSRTIQPGDYFIPIQGPNFDGRDFIQDAVAKGGILLDVDFNQFATKYRKQLSANVIAIVGSAGKTTVKDLLYSVLSPHFNVVKTHQNENNDIGAPLTILRADNDTDIVLVEMGLRKANDLASLTRIIRPSMVVFTGVGSAHLEFFASQRALATAKSRVFQRPVAFERDSQRQAFVYDQSPYYDLVAKRANQMGYQLFPYTGQSSVEGNMSVCYEVGRFFGLTMNQVQAGLAQHKGSDHRLVTHRFNQGILIDDSYNSNPEGMKHALRVMQQHSGRKIVIASDMGELGEAAPQFHRQLVEDVAAADVDILFGFGPLLCQCDHDDLSVSTFEDREAMHDHILAELKPEDVILVKGSRAFIMEKTVEYLLSHYS